MQEQVIVGAGLSGMVAAINLAREGYKVHVREMRDSVGGATDIKGMKGRVINIGDGSPINLNRLERYIGIDISPAAVPLPGARLYLYGKTFQFEAVPQLPLYLVERGPRKTSLDIFLYELAKSEGVQFSFNDDVTDFDDLPPDTIIATGLFGEPFKKLDVPNLQLFGYLAMSETEDMNPRVIMYFDEYTHDYAFYSQVNGARGAVLFSRGTPLDISIKERFAAQLAENDGIEFEEWFPVNIGAYPVKQFNNPRLFARNYILAGVISGTVEPTLLFGVHGALVSGKIAAMAVSDHYRALKEFRRINRYYPLGFLLSVLYRRMPIWLLKRLLWFNASLYPRLAPFVHDSFFAMMPGYTQI